MSTHATALILGVSNFVSLPAGDTENRLLLELPNGRRIEATISDEDLVAVAGCFGAPQEGVVAPPPKAVSHPPTQSDSLGIPDGAELPQSPSELFEEVQMADGPALVFGGVAAPDDFTPAPAAPVVHQAPPPRKTRVVGKDNAGNPVIEVIGAVSPNDITGTVGEKDEDGVAQL